MSGKNEFSPENCSVVWGDIKVDYGFSSEPVIVFEKKPLNYTLRDIGGGVIKVVSDRLTLRVKEGSQLHGMLLEDEGKSKVNYLVVNGKLHIKFGEFV